MRHTNGDARIHQIEEDRTFLDIPYSDEEICAFSKKSFKQILDRKVQQKRKVFLRSLQATKTKSGYLNFTDSPQPYITDPRFTKDQVHLLVALRSQTFNCKENFKWKFSDNLMCDLCYIFPCSMSHILRCSVILQNSNVTQADISSISLNMIYGGVEDQLTFICTYQKLVDTRRVLQEDNI